MDWSPLYRKQQSRAEREESSAKITIYIFPNKDRTMTAKTKTERKTLLQLKRQDLTILQLGVGVKNVKLINYLNYIIIFRFIQFFFSNTI